MKITSVDVNLYGIPLPNVLTDSTHGTMKDFALITVEVSCGKSICRPFKERVPVERFAFKI